MIAATIAPSLAQQTQSFFILQAVWECFHALNLAEPHDHIKVFGEPL